MATHDPASSEEREITLRDVITHMMHMEQRLSADIKNLDQKLSARMDALEQKIDGVEKRLTERIDALEEDLTATMEDTIKIRKHVGMAVVEE